MAGTAIISGAAGNLGKAMMTIFQDRGYEVVGLVAPGEAVKVEAGTERTILELDLTDDVRAAHCIDQLVSEKRNIEVAVLTVGGFEMGSILDTSLSSIEKQVKLNFNTAYSLVRPLFRYMKSVQQGRIFLVGSGPGMDMRKGAGMTAYGLSKSLIFRLAELLNAESSGLDIITQVIVPSTIDTPQNRLAMPDADFSKWVKAETIAKETLRCVKEAAENRLIIF